MLWNTNIGMMKMKDKIFNNLINYSLEDVYDILYKNRPNKNNIMYDDWVVLENELREELLNSDERPNECVRLINNVISFLKEDWSHRYEENRREIERQSK